MTKLAPGAKELVQSTIPLRGEMGRKWDIAMMCLFLASPAAAFVSGEGPRDLGDAGLGGRGLGRMAWG